MTIETISNGGGVAAVVNEVPMPDANSDARTRTRTRRSKSDTAADVDAELVAIGQCAAALATLAPEARSRVLLYLARRYEPPATHAVSVIACGVTGQSGDSDD